jgi:hypothetical protein
VNTPTLVTSLIFAAVLAVVIAFLMHLMMRGWRRRAELQIAVIGEMPALPDSVGPAIIPGIKGLYVGSTFAPSWQDRIAAGDLGYRTKAVLTRYPEGIMLQRSGGRPIWIPDELIVAVRTEMGIAGKVIPRPMGPPGKVDGHQGVLAIRWRLASGTEIDTGFRADDHREYDNWVTPGPDEAEVV